jgi:hypothetical protein
MDALYWIVMSVLAFLFIFYRRKSLSYEDLLLEASGRIEISRKQAQKIEADHAAKQLQIAQLKKLCESKETQCSDLEKNFQSLKTESALKLAAIESQLMELKENHEKLGQEYESLFLKHSILEKDKKALDTKPEEDLLELKTLKNKFEQINLENENNKITIKILTKDLEEKSRKLVNAEHLYLSMKGLKEISEERAENWEHALSKISDFVLKNNKDTYQDADSGDGSKVRLSSKVAKALEAIGANFDDIYTDENANKENSNAESI